MAAVFAICIRSKRQWINALNIVHMAFILVPHLTQELTILLYCAIVTSKGDIEVAFDIESTNFDPLLPNIN